MGWGGGRGRRNSAVTPGLGSVFTIFLSFWCLEYCNEANDLQKLSKALSTAFSIEQSTYSRQMEDGTLLVLTLSQVCNQVITLSKHQYPTRQPGIISPFLFQCGRCLEWTRG